MYSPSEVFRAIGDLLGSPGAVSKIAWVYILAYYAVSFTFVWVARRSKAGGLLSRLFKRNGVLDITSSAFWIFFAVLLIWSLLSLTAGGHLSLRVLAEFYLFFLFLFAFLYGLIEWHWPGKLENISPIEYEAEFEYFIISVGAQTTIGFMRARPNHWVTEIIAAAQAVLGVAFIAIWIALAISRTSG